MTDQFEKSVAEAWSSLLPIDEADREPMTPETQARKMLGILGQVSSLALTEQTNKRFRSHQRCLDIWEAFRLGSQYGAAAAGLDHVPDPLTDYFKGRQQK
jgi:hypothetical protein